MSGAASGEPESTATLQKLREKLGNARNRSLKPREEETELRPLRALGDVLYLTTSRRRRWNVTHRARWKLGAGKILRSSSALR
jgi:hypothetical protein